MAAVVKKNILIVDIILQKPNDNGLITFEEFKQGVKV